MRPKPDMYDPDDPAPSPRRISLPFVEPHEFEDEARAVPGFVARSFGRFWSGVTRHGNRA